MNKPIASDGMMNEVFKLLLKCPERDMEKYIKDKIIEFLQQSHTPGETYDFLQWVSDQPVIKINEKMCVGNISTFVKELCNMKRYYLRPE